MRITPKMAPTGSSRTTSPRAANPNVTNQVLTLKEGGSIVLDGTRESIRIKEIKDGKIVIEKKG
ncbi:MAG: hypothetical protein OEV94_03500 [Deltaproteobacteria bacterium]|nr:hypothetical protein [Deltaproteobacteria bacterium]